ncbi:MAG: hypothetical protein IPK19_15630 [Chloroflexi bacterium]|nr:hypothetical protein [Chloroflexota bacterium]
MTSATPAEPQTTTPTNETSPPAASAGVAVRALLIFFGLLVVVVGYFWSHRPFGIEPETLATTGPPPIVLTLGGAALDLVTVAVLFLVAGGIGNWMVARLRLHETVGLSRLEWLALEAGIGLGAWALLALAFGLLGLFQPAILWGCGRPAGADPAAIGRRDGARVAGGRGCDSRGYPLGRNWR